MKTRAITIHGHTATRDEIQDVMTQIRQNAETTLTRSQLAERYGLNCSYTSLRNFCDEQDIPYPTNRTRRVKMTAEPEAAPKQEIIQLKKTEKTVRKAMTISQSVSDRWDRVMEDIPVKSVAVDKALTDFLDAFEDGRIAFVLTR